MSEELEKLRHKQYVAERKLTAAKHKEKRLQSELKRLTRSERTHRLCTRAGMLETFLKEPTVLTDEDVMELMISTKVPCSNHPEEATLPLRWFCQLSLCGLAAEERLQAIIPRQQVNIPPPDRAEKYRSFFVPSKGGSTEDASTTFGNPHPPAEQGKLCRCRSCLPQS